LRKNDDKEFFYERIYRKIKGLPQKKGQKLLHNELGGIINFLNKKKITKEIFQKTKMEMQILQAELWGASGRDKPPFIV